MRHPDNTKDSVMMAYFVVSQNSKRQLSPQPKHTKDSRALGPMMEAICKPASLSKECDDQARANFEGHRYACDNAYTGDNVDVTEVPNIYHKHAKDFPACTVLGHHPFL